MAAPDPAAGPCLHPESARERLFAARDYVTGDPFRIERCAACGLAFTQPQPADLGRYYPDAYYGEAGQHRFPAPVEAVQSWLYRRRAARIEARLGRGPGRVLDVGCGRGHLLAAFRRRGWQCLGIELSEASARPVREAYGLEVRVGPLEALDLPTASFDAAVLWHVLEHAPDPPALVAELHRLLAPGGLLLVSVPDFGSPEARWAGPGWFHLDVPRHLLHFSRATLEGSLRRAGFATLERWALAPEFDLFSWIQSVENRLGLPQNLLYRALRGRSARLPGSPGGGFAALLAFLLALPLGLVGLPWTLLAGMAGRGSTATLLVRKEEKPT